MPKNLLQDMVREKRERRGMDVNAPIPRREIKMREPITEEKGRTKNALWVVAVVSIVFLFFALSYLFSKVTITVNPKVKTVVLNENLSAAKDAGADALSFDLVVISGEEDRDIQATEQKDMAESARGTAVIYNSFSTATQRLDINTRLEGSNGKMYKTEKAVTVPGMKGTTPGSVEIGIYAADPGPASNSAPLDFKIFGFKGTSKYDKFYARSKDPITGGLVGKFPVVSDSDKQAALDDTKIALQTKLFQKAKDQIPAGFILFKNAAILNIDSSNLDLASATSNSVPLAVKGTLYGILFDEAKLTKKIATDSIPGYDGNDVYIQNIQDLEFYLSNKDNTSFNDMQNVSFNVSGSTNIVWKFDSEKLAADLLGKPKKDFNQVLLQYPDIQSAQSVVTPFWKTSFPDKFKDIHVIVNYPK